MQDGNGTAPHQGATLCVARGCAKANPMERQGGHVGCLHSPSRSVLGGTARSAAAHPKGLWSCSGGTSVGRVPADGTPERADTQRCADAARNGFPCAPPAARGWGWLHPTAPPAPNAAPVLCRAVRPRAPRLSPSWKHEQRS